MSVRAEARNGRVKRKMDTKSNKSSVNLDSIREKLVEQRERLIAINNGRQHLLRQNSEIQQAMAKLDAEFSSAAGAYAVLREFNPELEIEFPLNIDLKDRQQEGEDSEDSSEDEGNDAENTETPA